MTISKQSRELYQTLLNSNKPLLAKDLGEKLGLYPNTIYRLAIPLLEIGLITKSKTYPLKFQAKSVDEGLSLFLLQQNDWFSKLFSTKNHQSDQISLNFIQSRDELMSSSEGEIKKATKSVDLLRSGHEIPAEVMLVLIEGLRRGIKVRMLIQDYTDENKEEVLNWVRNGIEVKVTELKHVRLMLYDKQVLYFMSYKHTDSEKDLGMKINYPPFAATLSDLFDSWWNKAKPI